MRAPICRVRRSPGRAAMPPGTSPRRVTLPVRRDCAEARGRQGGGRQGHGADRLGPSGRRRERRVTRTPASTAPAARSSTRETARASSIARSRQASAIATRSMSPMPQATSRRRSSRLRTSARPSSALLREGSFVRRRCCAGSPWPVRSSTTSSSTERASRFSAPGRGPQGSSLAGPGASVARCASSPGYVHVVRLGRTGDAGTSELREGHWHEHLRRQALNALLEGEAQAGELVGVVTALDRRLEVEDLGEVRPLPIRRQALAGSGCSAASSDSKSSKEPHRSPAASESQALKRSPSTRTRRPTRREGRGAAPRSSSWSRRGSRGRCGRSSGLLHLRVQILDRRSTSASSCPKSSR